ncbi:cytochrome P450 [Streptomyces sp. NPDC055092]
MSPARSARSGRGRRTRRTTIRCWGRSQAPSTARERTTTSISGERDHQEGLPDPDRLRRPRPRPRGESSPDQFDIDREYRRYLAFGYGIHFCLGVALARLGARTALPALFERFPRLRLATQPPELPPRSSFIGTDAAPEVSMAPRAPREQWYARASECGWFSRTSRARRRSRGRGCVHRAGITLLGGASG